MRVCFVCSGNICRSPTAEAVLVAMLREARLDGVDVDSAGTGRWHVGEEMDRRARATLTAHGYDQPTHVARQFIPADFATRDLVVALDRGHARELRELAGSADDPVGALDKIVLLRSFDPDADDLDVPDPYYGGAEGFRDVLAQIEQACRGLLPTLTTAL